MINPRKRHIQNGCCSRSTAFNFPPSFYAYGIRISKGKRWKLLETSSRGRSNYKDGLKPRDLAFRWLFPDISWNCCNWYPKLSIHFSRMGRERRTNSLSRQWTLAVWKRSRIWHRTMVENRHYFHSSILYSPFSWAKSTRPQLLFINETRVSNGI